MKHTYFIGAIIALIGTALVVSGCTHTDSGITTNSTAGTDGVSGTLDIKGSDTLLQLVSSMAEEFNTENTSAAVSVTGGGSGTGIAALLNGEVVMANASRDVKDSEVEAAAEAGYEFKKFIVARDGLSIIVHPSNGVTQLTMDQVGQIFRGDITNWSEVGGSDADINLYGRQSTSGTYEFMQDEVLQGDYTATMRNLEGNQAIVDAVVDDETGIGYVGIGYAVNAGDAVNILDIASTSDATYFDPTDDSNVASGDYPITRPLFQIMLETPPDNGVIESFLEFEQSDEGLAIIKDVGFYPPNATDTATNQVLFDAIDNQ